MKYLVDSDWIADYLAGKQQAVNLLDRLVPEGVGISLITYGEIFEGLYYGHDPRVAEIGFRELLQAVDVVPLGRRIMLRFARIRGQLRQEGRLIGDPDLLIASTALHHNVTLVTRNRKHFERISDLRLYP